MSEQGPQPADAVREAVRRVRLAAASLSNPLGAVGLAFAVAEALPRVMQPALASLAPSPFGVLAGVGSAAAAGLGPVFGPTAGRGAAAAPPSAAPTPAGPPATGPTAAVAALGRFVTDELTALGVTALKSQAPALPDAGALGQAVQGFLGGQAPLSLRSPEFADLMTAQGWGDASSQARAGAAVATAARSGGVPSAVAGIVGVATTGVASGLTLLETLVREGEAAFGLTPPPQRRAAPAESPLGEVFGAVPAAGGGRAPGPSDSPLARLFGAIPTATAGLAPAAGEAPIEPAPPAARATPIDEMRRRLLDPTAASVTGQAPGAPAPAPTPIPYPNLGAAVPAAPAQLEPDDLAWLVNEALVEQARRHGVDLT